MEYNFKKTHIGKDLAVSVILIIAGAGCFFLNKGIGIMIAACGLVSLLLYKAGYKVVGKDYLLTKKSEDLCKCCKSSLMDYLNGKDITPEIKRGNEGGSIRLDVYFDKANAIVYAQLFDFSNYEYVPATEVVEIYGERAEKLISKF